MGSRIPWPAWVHADDTLDQVAWWLRRFLDAYGWSGDLADFVDLVRARLEAHIAGIRTLAAAGDPVFVQLLGRVGDLECAIAELPALG